MSTRRSMGAKRVWCGLLLLLFGLSHCLSHRDLSGFPCPQDRTCPAPLICQAGVCIAPGQTPETNPQEPDTTDGSEASPEQTRPEPKKETTPETQPESPGEATFEPVPEGQPEGRPEPRPETIPEPPASLMKVQEDVLFQPEDRRLWGLTASTNETRLLIAGGRGTSTSKSGILLKGPDYQSSLHWSTGYASREPLYDVAWVGGSVYIAVGDSRQSGATAEYGPVIRSTRAAFASGWGGVKLAIPDANEATSTLYRLALDKPGATARILTVGTTDRDGGASAKGLILESDDQGATWTQLQFDAKPTTIFYDAVYRQSNTETRVVVVGNKSGIFEGTAISGALGWQKFTPPQVDGDYLAIAAVAPNDLVLSIKSSQGGNALHYYDGSAKRWNPASHPALPSQINGLSTLPSGLIVAMGNNGQLLQSTDRGRSWTTVVTNTREHLHRALFHKGRLYITGDHIVLSSDLP